MDASLSNRLPAAQPVQVPLSRVSGRMEAPFSNRCQPGEPVQVLLPRASWGMEAANRSCPAVDNKGMEARDGFARSERQVA